MNKKLNETKYIFSKKDRFVLAWVSVSLLTLWAVFKFSIDPSTIPLGDVIGGDLSLFAGIVVGGFIFVRKPKSNPKSKPEPE